MRRISNVENGDFRPPPSAKRLPPGNHAAAVGPSAPTPSCLPIVPIVFQVLVSQSFTSLAKLIVSRCFPPGEKLAKKIASLPASRLFNSFPSAALQIFTLPSSPAVASSFPSGENSML
jgi:hypothetical protein